MAITYIKALRRAIYYPPSSKMCVVRTKYNEALNYAVAEIGHNIMNVNECCLPEHYDNWGKLIETGNGIFWQQVDDLIEQFDNNKIMLLPAAKIVNSRTAAVDHHRMAAKASKILMKTEDNNNSASSYHNATKNPMTLSNFLHIFGIADGQLALSPVLMLPL